MTFLKIALYVLLIFCLTWGAVVFLGPSIIRIAVDNYFAEKVSFKEIEISPSLEVDISKLRYVHYGNTTKETMVFEFRNVQLDWSFFSQSPFLKLAAQTAIISDMGEIEEANMLLNFNAEGDWYAAKAELDLNGVDFGDHLKFQKASITGDFYFLENLMENIEFAFLGARSNNAFSTSAGVINGNITKYNFLLSVSEQENSATLEFSDVASGLLEQDAKIASFDLDNAYGILSINSDFSELSGSIMNNKVDELKLNIGYKFVDSRRHKTQVRSVAMKNASFEITGSKPVPNLSFESFKADFYENEQGQKLNLSAEVDSLEVLNERLYVGGIKNTAISGVIDFDRLRDKENDLYSNGVFEVTLNNNETISIYSDFTFSVVTNLMPIDCLTGACDIKNINISYVVNVSGSELNGNTYCEKTPCNSLTTSNQIMISDSTLFFDGLARSQVLSPLALSILYSQVLSGEEIGLGRRLNF